MARIRYIKPEAFDDPELCALPPLARWLFAGLWTQADRAGRLEDEPKRLKARLLPYDDVDVDQELAALALAGLITRYEANGKPYIQIRSFEKHQRPHPKEPVSVIPPAVKKHGKPRKETASRDHPVHNYNGDGDFNGDGDKSVSPEAAEPPSEPAVLVFPVVGSKDCHEWPLTRSQLDEWGPLYPGLDVLATCRNALAWARANPTKRKTAKGMPRFLVSWLTREQNQGRPRANGPPAVDPILAKRAADLKRIYG